MQRGAVRSGDAEIAFGVLGEGDETVVLVMGLGGRSADWGESFPAALAERYRVVLFDNRGTGTSSRVPGPYSLEQLARDTVAVIDAVSAERAHVLGISMGGMIAQHVALDFPRRVHKLVLVSTHCGGPRAHLPAPRVIPHLFPDPSIPAGEIVRRRFAAIAAPGWAERHPELLEERVRIALAAPTPVRTYRAQVDAILRADRYARLDEIDAPTLVVHGDRDDLVPFPNAETLVRRIPDARLVTLPGVGHLPMWEAPHETSRAVLEFLGSA